MEIPKDWTFKTEEVASHFDSHVREQLPWYELATQAVAHFMRCYIRPNSTVYDIGASTGNIGRSVAGILEARSASLIGIDNSEQMASLYKAPGHLVIAEAQNHTFEPFSVATLFLVCQFLSKIERRRLLDNLQEAVEPGGAIILVDRFESLGGYFGQSVSRLTIAGKLSQGADPKQVLEKELSLSGVQRPLDYSELKGSWRQFFKFSDFEGFIFEA